MYCVQQFVFVTVVANGRCGKDWGKGMKTVLRRVLNRYDWEWFGVTQDGISDTPQNDNRT
jgi:hypothetical protein